MPCLHHIDSFAQLEGSLYVLLHQENGCPKVTVNFLNNLCHILEGDGGQSAGRFVEQEQLRLSQQAHSDPQHPPLPAAEGARQLLLTILQYRKKLIDLVQSRLKNRMIFHGKKAHLHIITNCEVVEHKILLG